MSFRRRRAAERVTANGVRASPHSGRLVTSTGLHALDAALGGGLALGALTLVVQDECSAFFAAMAAYVVAQGVVNDHSICVASPDASARRVMGALPALAGERAEAMERATEGVREMSIAWRYGAGGGSSGVRRAEHAAFVSDFDIGRRGMVPRSARVHVVARETSPSRLLGEVRAMLERARCEGRLARVVVTGASEALLRKADDELSFEQMVARLRALGRLYGAVIVVMCSANVPRRLQCVLSDACLKIDTFGGRGASVAGLGSEWMGVLMVNKAYREGRSAAFRGVGDVWVFKRGRRKYTMERATAAPDEEQLRADGDDDGNSKSNGMSLCSSTPSESALQF